MRKLLGLLSEKGSGIVEMLVVVALVGSVGMVVVAMPLYFTGSSVRSDQYMKRTNTIESVFGFGTAKLTGANSNDIGMGPRSAPAQEVPSYHDVVLEDQPFAYYGLNEPANATTVVNSSPVNRQGLPPSFLNLSYRGTVQKAEPSLLPRYANDPESGNRSVSFNGQANNYMEGSSLQFNPSTTLPENNTFTLEAWVNVTTTTTNRAILSYGPSSYTMAISTSNNILRLMNYTTTIASFGNLTPGVHHVVIVRSGATATAYVDGETLSTVSVTADTNVVTDTGARFKLGVASNGMNGHSSPMNGGVDEVAIYDKALTQDRVQWHYTAGTTDSDSGSQSGVVPVSLAGDQMLFKRYNVCYRMFHDRSTNEIKVASYNTAATSETPEEKDLCHSIRAVRGPNEDAPSDINPSHPLHDPVLDNPESPTFTLTTVGRNIQVPPSGRVFTFLDPDGSVIDVDAEADSSTSNPVYASDITVDHIDAIEMEAEIVGAAVKSSLITDIPGTTFRQRYPLALNCPRE